MLETGEIRKKKKNIQSTEGEIWDINLCSRVTMEQFLMLKAIWQYIFDVPEGMRIVVQTF